MSDELKCAKCGQELPDKARFCTSCGAAVETADVEIGNLSDSSPDSLSDNDERPQEPEQEVIIDKGQPAPSDEAGGQENIDATSDSGREESASQESDAKNKKKLGRKAKKRIIVGSIVAVIAILVIALVCCASAAPLKCDAHVTVGGVQFGYPAQWQLEEKDDKNGQLAYIRPDTDGIVSISSRGGKMTLSDYSMDQFLKELGATLKGEYIYYKIENHDAAKASITWESNGRPYEGLLLLVSMDYSTTSCLAGVSPSAPSFYINTYKEIIKSAQLDISTEEYEVTFESEGEVVAKEVVTYKSGGVELKIPENIKRDGYVLSGWEAKDGSNNVTVGNSGAATYIYNMKGDCTLVAKWELAFTVTFTDGLGTVLKTETVKEGESAVPPTDPTRSGYTFAGWSGKYSDVTENVTVSAKWTKIPTVSESNALKKAQQYLRSMAFSYSGLIEQLEYEGFSNSDATYGVDNCGADWNVQAAKKAKQYLDIMAFSRDGLIEQLEYEGFTPDQAVYGVDSVGL